MSWVAIVVWAIVFIAMAFLLRPLVLNPNGTARR
jgi:hypothetical protein